MNDNNIKKRKTMSFDDFKKNIKSKAQKKGIKEKGENKISKKAFSGPKQGDKGYATLENENFDLNETATSSQSLTEIKYEFFIKAKNEYIKTISELLKAEGIKVKKVNTPYNNIDDFASDSLTCTYGEKTFQVEFSNRGVSIGLDAQKRDAGWNRAVGTKYYTKVKTFANAIKSSIDNEN